MMVSNKYIRISASDAERQNKHLVVSYASSSYYTTYTVRHKTHQILSIVT